MRRSFLPLAVAAFALASTAMMSGAVAQSDAKPAAKAESKPKAQAKSDPKAAPAKSAAKPATKAVAKDPACRPTGWTTTGGSKTIVDGTEDRFWVVSVGGIANDTTVVLEYASALGIKGEVVMASRGAEVVEAATMSIRVEGGSRVPVNGTYQIQCNRK